MERYLWANRHDFASLNRATTSEPPFDVPFAPVSNAEFEREEEHLGVRLPLLLKRLYTEVGNGGFGPGHGLLTMVPLSNVDRPIPLYYPDYEPSWQLPKKVCQVVGFFQSSASTKAPSPFQKTVAAFSRPRPDRQGDYVQSDPQAKDSLRPLLASQTVTETPSVPPTFPISAPAV